MSLSENSSISSGCFSGTTKLKTKDLAGKNCWACGTPDTDVAHVIAKADTQIPLWEEAGLFPNFNYKSTDNAIPLCPVCHREFDMADDPCFVFFPTDLRFFIDFELSDEIQRENTTTRQVPSAEAYKTHQVMNKTISSNAKGGLYTRVYLKNFFLGGLLPEDTLRELSSDKQWHGNPIASLRRAFAILGSPRVYILDTKTRDELDRLRFLYFGKTLLNPSDNILRTIYQKGPVPAGKRSQAEEQDQSGQVEKKMKVEKTQNNATTSANVPSDSQSGINSSWVLGPHITTNKVIQLYSPLFATG